MRLLMALCLGCFSCLSQAQEIERSFGISYGNGSIYAHTKDVENTMGSKPTGFQLSYNWRKLDSATFQKFSGLPTQSLFINYTNFDNSILGNGFIAAYAIQPNIRFSNKVGLQFQTAAGFAYLSSPYNSIHNPTNSSYSTSISAYLDLGLNVYWQFADQWQLSLGGHYRHLSNAGIKLPNKGVNWTTTDISIRYALTPIKPLTQLINQYNQLPYQKYKYWEFYAFGAARSISNELMKRYPIYGMGITRSWQTARSHGFTAGIELYHDGALAEQLSESNQTTALANALSVLGGHAFLWGKVAFTQQIGVYLISHGSNFPSWYHRWGLQYQMNKKLALGINLKAHKQVAQFPDLRLIYRLGNSTVSRKQ